MPVSSLRRLPTMLIETEELLALSYCSWALSEEDGCPSHGLGSLVRSGLLHS